MPKGRKIISSKKHKTPAAPKEEALVADSAPVQGHVMERPDGFYWEAKKGEPHGPFPTLAEAEADMLSDGAGDEEDRKSTRLNSSHTVISYAVFCLKKKTMPEHVRYQLVDITDTGG